MNDAFPVTLRKAGPCDVAGLERLTRAAILGLMPAFLRPEEVEASLAFMGVDRRLIDDGTYFVAERDGRIVGAGGWSARATLFGGDHARGRDDSELDPATEPARMRAMYTHPEFARRGIGRRILAHCEACATALGFGRATLVATMAGQPLYRACGYREIEYLVESAAAGVAVPLVRMEKMLVPASR